MMALLGVFFLFDLSYVNDSIVNGEEAIYATSDLKSIEEANCEIRSALHLDWPVFYFSIQPLSIPENINQICSDHKRKLTRLIALYTGDSYNSADLINYLDSITLSDHRHTTYAFIDQIYQLNDVHSLKQFVYNPINDNEEIVRTIKNKLRPSNPWKSYVPVLLYHGTKNRFHAWLKNALVLNFGYSILDRQSVSKKINQSLKQTLIFTVPAVLLIFIISIALAYSVSSDAINRVISNVLYFIDSIPLFWLSIMMIILFSNLGVLSWSFTSSITSNVSNLDLGQLANSVGRHTLPILALTLSSVPFVHKQVLTTVQETKTLPHVETAIAKGMSSKAIFKRHIFKNSLTPVITLFFTYLAFAFGGAFVIEMVFSINGIGKLMADSVIANDFPVITVIILYLILIKMILTLIGDIINAIIDPSIKFRNN